MRAWLKKSLLTYFFYCCSSSMLFATCPATVSTCGTNTDMCGPSLTSHSVFMGKPAAQNAMLELGQNNFLRYHTKKCHTAEQKPKRRYYFRYREEECELSSHNCSWFVDLFPFFFVSTQANKITEYLLPDKKCSLTVADNNTSDISSPWIDISSSTQTFASTLSFHPQRKSAGFAFSFFTNLYWLCTSETQWPERVWFELFAPLEWVQHNLGLKEVVNTPLENSTGEFTTATQAFNNPAWCYGKLPCKPLNKFGCSDILLRLGFDAIRSEQSHLGFYLCIFVPTTGGFNSKYLFEPVLGNLGHTGVGGGINTDWCIWQNGNLTSVNWMMDLRGVYFFKRHEIRSTDLSYNLDWSRYLEVAYTSSLGTPLPGINFFTQSIEISPRSSVNAWLAFHLQHCSSHLELGYNFWWRQRELAKDFSLPAIVIYDIQGTPGDRTSASTATISTGAPGTGAPISDITPLQVDACMLSDKTCAIPNIYINSFYISYGAQFMHCERPVLVSAGFYYDMSRDNTSFSGVGGWLKGSFVF